MSQRSGELSDSYVQSIHPSTTESTITSVNDNGSASQILSRSDVFRSPTMRRLAESPDRESNLELPHLGIKHARTDSRNDKVLVSPPSRSQTDQPFSPPLDHNAGRTPRASSDLPGAGFSHSSSTQSFQQYVKGSLPVQKAAGLAGYLRRNSKKMSTLLATESMGYVEKVSGMWAGGRKHYGEAQSPLDEMDDEAPVMDDTGIHGDRFRAHFALPATEILQATYFGYLFRVLPLYGKVYIGNRHVCFRSLLPGTRTKLILPLAHIENVSKERGFTGFRPGLVIAIKAYEELLFEFSSADIRDDCTITLLQSLDTIRALQGDDEIIPAEEIFDAKVAQEEHKMLQEARLDGHSEHEINLPKSASTTDDPHPILFDDPRASIINFKPTESLRVTCLTIGSRGDVQPYIALAKGLIAEGHKARIATHREFESWIRGHGIDFAPVEGDPAELMRICVENGMFTYSFLKEASVKFRGWIDELLSSAWKACQETDVLIESPSAMAGIHIAEALEIPYFRAFGMPWTRTRAYPHAFAVPERKMGGAYNYITYVMFDNVFWTAIAGQVNRWRKKELGLHSTNLDKLHPNKVPFLYNFSPSVVVPPIDYSDWIRVTGYWFLDEGTSYTPDPALAAFIAKARNDKKKLVYIGFGSIVVSDPAALTKTVVDSVLKADVRCILSKGWSDRLGPSAATSSTTHNHGSSGSGQSHHHDPSKPEITLPPEIHQIKSAPHDWLFKQIDAAAHHGGAGTTGASLRAGLPTIIKPFFGDQFFFGSRVEDLGVGICMKKLNVSVFSRALWEATNSERIIVRAKVLGEAIRKVGRLGFYLLLSLMIPSSLSSFDAYCLLFILRNT